MKEKMMNTLMQGCIRSQEATDFTRVRLTEFHILKYDTMTSSYSKAAC